MTTELLKTKALTRHFAGVTALDEFSFTLEAKEILGLFGPNGSGKTTMFNVLTGFIPPETGEASCRGRSLLGLPPHRATALGITRSFQDLRLIRRITALENVLLCFKNQPGEKLLNVVFRPGLCKRHEADNLEKALELLDMARLSEKANDLADNLSYGQQKLLSLVCCLAADAELLLLDEPVAGIAPEMAGRILAIIAELPKQGKSAIVIEHDMGALKSIAHRMIFMDAGRKVCEGTPEAVLNEPCVIEAYLD